MHPKECRLASNRTIMELKWAGAKQHERSNYTSNRTIMELKLL